MTTITAATQRPVRVGAAPHRCSAAIAPGLDELIDALALLALTMIGIVGFRPAYGGHGYLVAGAAGVVLGLLLSHVGERARVPLVAVVAASILAFLAFGGVVSQTGTISLPTLQAVMNAAVSGWQQLLTTARPVGRTASLLVLPYLLGLFSGVAGHALARRTATVLLPAAAPAVVVALSILFGAPRPVDAVLQGAGFAAVALAWAAVRQERGAGRQITIGRQRPWQRIGAGAVVLAVAGAGAVFIGPHLPGAGAHKRVVLTVAPPFNIDEYPSPRSPPTATTPRSRRRRSASSTRSCWPLGGCRRAPWCASPRWTATTDSPGGSPTRRRRRMARSAASSRLARRCPGAPVGPAKTATITTTAYDRLPWLPDVAGVTGISFSGAGQACGGTAAAALRFNVATGTGIIPCYVPAGLSYTVSYVPAPVACPERARRVTPLAQLGAASPGDAFDPVRTGMHPGPVRGSGRSRTSTTRRRARRWARSSRSPRTC